MFVVPAMVIYVILTLIFMAYKPQRFVTVPNPCKSLCYNYVMGDNAWGEKTILGIEHYPETIQQEVDYMGIGDYMFLVPLKLFFAVCIGLFLFVIVFGVYRSLKKFVHAVIDIWKP